MQKFTGIKLITTIITVGLLAASSQTLAGDAAAGKTKAMSCGGCHGAAGISPNDLWPNLAGQKAGYLAKQIKDFRDGRRNDPVMSNMVKTLSDQDAEDIAAFYAGLK